MKRQIVTVEIEMATEYDGQSVHFQIDVERLVKGYLPHFHEDLNKLCFLEVNVVDVKETPCKSG